MIKNLLKHCLFTFALSLISLSSIAQFVSQLPISTTTTTTRCPVRGNQKFYIGAHLYGQSEINALNGSSIDSISFTASSSTVVGVKKGYLEAFYKFVTEDTLTFNKTDSFTTIISSFTPIFADSVILPSTAGEVYVKFTSPIALNGQNIILAYRWAQPGVIVSAGPTATYQAFSSATKPRTCITSVSQTVSPATFNVPTSNVFSTFRPAVKWYYSYNGIDARVTDLSIDGTLQPGNNYVVKAILANFGTVAAPAGGKISYTDGTTTFTDSNLPSITPLTQILYTFSTSNNFAPAIGNKLYNIKSYFNTYAGDLNLANDTLKQDNYVFATNSILMQNFNDSSQFKNVAPFALATGTTDWLTINNSAGAAGATGPWFINNAGVLPNFEGRQSVAQNFSGATPTVAADKWLVSPKINVASCLADMDSLFFYTRKAGATFPDSIEVLVSPSGASAVTDFTASLGYVNASTAWEKKSFALNSSLSTTSLEYRFAFRYKGNQPNLSYAALDAISIGRTLAPATNLLLNFTSPLTFCEEDTTITNLIASSTTPGATFTWISPLDTTVIDTIPFSANSLMPGTYTFVVVATSPFACPTTSLPQSIVINPRPIATLSVSPSSVIAIVGSTPTPINITLGGGINYNFNVSALGSVSTLINPPLSIFTASTTFVDSIFTTTTGTGSVIYQVIAVNSFGCLSAALSDTLTVDIFTNITNNELDKIINIAPNPSSSVVNINVLNNNFDLVLFDTAGRRVVETRNNLNATKLDITNLDNGIYYLHITSNNIVSIKKVLINR